MADIQKPAVTVIITLHNSEEFISKCLDSLLNQTFQDFEVIVIDDDGSTDNSCAVVEGYSEKFNGRLKIFKAEDSVALAGGEYVQFLDANDMLTKTALEELTTLTKDFDADVVSCEKFYVADSDGANIQLNVDEEEDLTAVPTFEPEDLRERIQNMTANKHSLTTWTKFIKRSLLTENEIPFRALNDDIWIYSLIFHAKKFLHVPNAVYIRRMSELSELSKTPQQYINFELNPILLNLKTLDKQMSRQEFFSTNPDCRFALLKKFIDARFNQIVESSWRLEENVIYSTLKETFGEKFGEYDVLIPALCAALYDKKLSSPITIPHGKKKNRESDAEILAKFKRWFSIRLDIQLKTTIQKDFQIVSISDDKAEIRQPDWFNRNGVGYVIQSYAGKLKIVFQVIAGGPISVALKGLFYPDPKNKGKRLPYWVDYTKLTVNDKVIFNKLTPVWHDKPYNYNLNAKAGEEVTVSVEWLPHRGDT